jgi:hypothetical protein
MAGNRHIATSRCVNANLWFVRASADAALASYQPIELI